MTSDQTAIDMNGSGGDRHVVDMLIIGAGPTGLYCAYYAGFRGLSVAMMDSLEEPGGQITAMYPAKMIFDVAGLPAIKGQDLVDNLVQAAAPFNPLYILGHRAETLVRSDDGTITVTSHKGAEVLAKVVIITGGIGTFTPRPTPVGKEYEGRGLRYFVPKPAELADQDTLIVGGGDSAVDWALALEPICRSVSLIHRRDEFRAHHATVQQMLASSVNVITSAEISGVDGDDAGIKAVEVTLKKTGEKQRLEVQQVVAALGFTAQLGPILTWGLKHNKRQIEVDTKMETNLPGVFAAGDITEYPGKVRIISVGFGEAATAVNNAASVVDPSLKLFPGHSSNPDQAPTAKKSAKATV